MGYKFKRLDSVRFIDLEKLEQTSPRLFKVARRCLSLHGDLERIPPIDIALQLDDWFDKHYPEINFDFQKEVLEIRERENKRLKAERDKRAGLARLDSYTQQGLEPTEANAQAVQSWLDANTRGYWSTEGVDTAVESLGPRGSNTLAWKQAAAPVVRPKPKRAVVARLSNGEERLPLNTTNAVLRRSSKEQVQDWLARRRAK